MQAVVNLALKTFGLFFLYEVLIDIDLLSFECVIYLE